MDVTEGKAVCGITVSLVQMENFIEHSLQLDFFYYTSSRL